VANRSGIPGDHKRKANVEEVVAKKRMESITRFFTTGSLVFKVLYQLKVTKPFYRKSLAQSKMDNETAYLPRYQTDLHTKS